MPHIARLPSFPPARLQPTRLAHDRLSLPSYRILYSMDAHANTHPATETAEPSQHTPIVSVRDIAADNWRDALALSLHPAQLRFVSGTLYPVALALAKAYIRPGGLHVAPFGIYADEVMVGFFALSYEPDSTDRYLLMHFLIDTAHQRRGYGLAALHAFASLLPHRYSTCTSVSLTMHPDNVPARSLYTRFGFEDTGTLLFGEPCYRLTVSPAS